MIKTNLPDADEMYAALLRRDSEYDGVFFVGVRSTGVFCRPVCPARKPLRRNVCFFAVARDALAAGYRACKRCRPLDVSGEMPDWLRELITHVEQDPSHKWTDEEIRAYGVEPRKVRRWFLSNHDMTFHSFMRCRRLSTALARLSVGDDPMAVAMNAGYESVSGFRDAFQKWLGQTPGCAGNNSETPILVNRILTRLGPMVVAADNRLQLLEFADRRMLETQFRRLARLTKRTIVPGENSVMEQTQLEIDQYFEGTRTTFDVPISISGTEFQVRVWRELLQIPYGSTSSYERIAERIGNVQAQRAVGRANGDNRLAIIVPCHRVIRSNGEISGYGGGVRRKEWLLNHEQQTTPAETTYS